ncbi:uncharacterized protein LOC130743991 [Lotus japonicus]|uniref:uncharacterized protein LOC130743991 n=1 Tax=Lotus japonicus TaxID=34305 RepID=UPI00258C1AE8|nr:uncharacterized protein LOC130743991 [Lotus japonicus]
MEVFMDYCSVFGASFDLCLENLDTVLKRCVKTNMVLNWEKCHFMVTEGIVIGHKISSRGIEVDKENVEVIEKLLKFIKEFSKIAKPLSNLLNMDYSFLFDSSCLKAFEQLKQSLIYAFVIIAPDWKLNFELMCDVAIKYLLTKPYSKPRLVRLQEFDLEIKDKSEKENAVAGHLSWLVNDKVTPKENEITYVFPDEKFSLVQERPWFAYMVNFKAGCNIPDEFNYHHKKKLLRDATQFVWDDPYLFKAGVDEILRRWVEAVATPKADGKTVIKFLKKNIFNRFGAPRAIISDGGSHFVNSQLGKALEHDGVKHKVNIGRINYTSWSK